MVKNEESISETWTCMICGQENPINEHVCQSCGACREEPAYDAIADDEDPNYMH